MPRPKETQKNDIKLAINAHLHLHGPNKWPELMAKYPDTSRATFFRYIKEVREDIEKQAGENSGAELKMMQKRIRSQTVTPEQTKRQMKANMPVSPSPAIIVGMGQNVEEVFNFMAHFNQLLRDADMMRKKSVKVDANGTESLQNPMLMDRSMGRRIDLIETWVRTQDLVWNMEKMQELYFLIIEEVGKVDSDTQQAILARIRTLNNKRGLTVDARLS